MRRRDFDEITQNVVVLDLQALNAGKLDVIGLHARDHATTFIPEAARVVEFLVISFRDEPSVAREEWRLRN